MTPSTVTGSLMGDPGHKSAMVAALEPYTEEMRKDRALAALDRDAERRLAAGERDPQAGRSLTAADSDPAITGEIPSDLSVHHGQIALRPVAALDLPDLKPGTPPTRAPMIENLPPTELLVDPTYQRELSDKSIRLIRRIVEGWDWRRFKPPIVAWSERGFEVIDGQHTAIAAATHGKIATIPCVVIDATELQDRAGAFVGHNVDRTALTSVQIHHGKVAAGDPEAVTVEQVCARAGVTILRTVWGSYAYKAGDTVAVGAIAALIGRRGAKRAREILETLAHAQLAPIAANDIKAAELLFTNDDFANDLEPLPQGGEHLAAAIISSAGSWPREAKELSATKCIPLWRAQAGVWFRKCRKRRAGS